MVYDRRNLGRIRPVRAGLGGRWHLHQLLGRHRAQGRGCTMRVGGCFGSQGLALFVRQCLVGLPLGPLVVARQAFGDGVVQARLVALLGTQARPVGDAVMELALFLFRKVGVVGGQIEPAAFLGFADQRPALCQRIQSQLLCCVERAPARSRFGGGGHVDGRQVRTGIVGAGHGSLGARLQHSARSHAHLHPCLPATRGEGAQKRQCQHKGWQRGGGFGGAWVHAVQSQAVSSTARKS